MSGYCPDCGNTICLCKEIELEINNALDGILMADANLLKEKIEYYESKLKQIQTELTEARAALAFYFNYENWDYEEIEESDQYYNEDTCAVVGGKKAIAFFEKYPGVGKMAEEVAKSAPKTYKKPKPHSL